MRAQSDSSPIADNSGARIGPLALVMQPAREAMTCEP